MFIVVLFLSLAVLSSAGPVNQPEPCETPLQWEGTAWHDNEEDGVMIVSELSYDAKDDRIRTLSHILNGPESGYVCACIRLCSSLTLMLSTSRKSFEMILLYSEERFYFIPQEGKEHCAVDLLFLCGIIIYSYKLGRSLETSYVYTCM